MAHLPDTPPTPIPSSDEVTQRILLESCDENTDPDFELELEIQRNTDRSVTDDDLGFERPLFNQDDELRLDDLMPTPPLPVRPLRGREATDDALHPQPPSETEGEKDEGPGLVVMPMQMTQGTDKSSGVLPPAFSYTSDRSWHQRHRTLLLGLLLVTCIGLVAGSIVRLALWRGDETVPKRHPSSSPSLPLTPSSSSSSSPSPSPPDLARLLEVRRWMDKGNWSRAAEAYSQLPRRLRRTTQLRLWHAEILQRSGHLERSREAYQRLLSDPGLHSRKMRIEAMIGLSEVLLDRNDRAASRAMAHRARRLLGADELGGLRQRIKRQLVRCEVRPKQ